MKLVYRNQSYPMLLYISNFSRVLVTSIELLMIQKQNIAVLSLVPRRPRPPVECIMPACESKLVCRSSRKATVAKTVLIG